MANTKMDLLEWLRKQLEEAARQPPFPDEPTLSRHIIPIALRL